MPITPLHFGLATPLKVIRGDKFSVPAFIVANCVMDIEPIVKVLFNLPGELHAITHNYLMAFTLWGLCWLWTKAAYWDFDSRAARIDEGFMWGVMTHVFIDSLVHAEMNPLQPLLGNPFYIDGMKWTSILLFAGVVWGLTFFTGPVSERRRLALKRLARARAYFASIFQSMRQ